MYVHDFHIIFWVMKFFLSQQNYKIMFLKLYKIGSNSFSSRSFFQNVVFF